MNDILQFPVLYTNEPGTVPKLGKLMEFLRLECLPGRHYNPAEHGCIDESTARTQSRFCRLKHIMKHKPEDGILIYCWCESLTGYLINFVVDLKDGTSVEAMMLKTLEPGFHQGFKVWADNLFVSIISLKKLSDKEIGFAGTTRTNFGFSKSLLEEIGESRFRRGDWRFLMSEDGILACARKDTADVKIMSNWHSPEEGSVSRRVSSSERKIFPAPSVVSDYNKYMGGVDQRDGQKAQYTTLKSRKWWRALSAWMLDMALANSTVRKAAGSAVNRDDAHT